MIVRSDIESNKRHELLEILINNLRAGDTQQIYLLKPLVAAGMLLEEDRIIEIKIKAFIDECAQSIESNSNYAFLLGYIYKNGIFVTQDYSRAIELFNIAIRRDNKPEAQNELALMHLNGLGTRENKELATSMFRRLIANDRHSNAMVNLSKIINPSVTGIISATYIRSDIDIRNAAQAIELLQNAFALENIEAMYRLGYSFHYNLQRRSESLPYLERAVDAGFADAIEFQIELHQLRYDEVYDDIFQLLKFAEKIGHPRAFYRLAEFFYDNLPAAERSASVIKYYKNAIDLGYNPAIISLAEFYENSERNNIEAIRLYRLHAERTNDVMTRSCSQAVLDTRQYRYHSCMQANNIQGAIFTLSQNPEIIHEFLAYDCRYPLNIDRITNFLRRYAQHASYMSMSVVSGNDLYTQTLLKVYYDAYDNISTNQTNHTLISHIINEFSIADIKEIYLTDVTNVFINLWYSENLDTHDASNLVSQVVHRLILSKEHFDGGMLKNVALILIADYFNNDNLTINLDTQVSKNHLSLLVGLKNFPALSFQAVNNILNQDLIIRKNPAIANTGFFHESATDESSLTPDDSMRNSAFTR